MASERGPVATEIPPAAPAAPQTATASTAPTATPDVALAADLARPKTLKRSRETTPPSTLDEADDGGDLSPTKLARLVGYTTQSPPSAPLDDERRTQDDPHQSASSGSNEHQHSSLSELIISNITTSLNHPQEQPTVLDAASDAAARALRAADANHNAAAAELSNVSPDSAASGASLGDASAEVVHSPGQLELEPRNDQRLYAPQPDAQMEDKAAASLSYPGVLPPGAPMAAPAPPRGMSLPMAGSQDTEQTPRSPSSKKHKCQYCATEFTRHHNLKSHLLTHSHEKPYACQTCQMRFRRLHDLKRHSKLHTGEKPHICPKCDRKFARGDALARHSKGAGGCAGRRPSMGGFGEEDYEGAGATGADDSAMSGVLYDGSAEADMTEEERRRLSLPSIKAQHVPGQPAPDGYTAHSNTYPPAGPRPGGLYPPNVDRGSTSSTTSPSVPNSHTPHTSISSMPLSAGGSSMYSQSGMTESPKPLSPGAGQSTQGGNDASTLGHQRSPAQHQHFRPADQPPSGLSLPSHGNTAPPSGPPNQQPVPRSRGRASSGTGATQGSNGASAVDNNNLFAAGDSGVWAYITHYEERFKDLQTQVDAGAKERTQLQERLNVAEQSITSLVTEVSLLRKQLAEYQEAPTAQS